MLDITRPKHTLLTAAELAARWRLPQNSICTYAKNRQIPAIRLGDRVLFSLAIIESIEAGTQDSAAMA